MNNCVLAPFVGSSFPLSLSCRSDPGLRPWSSSLLHLRHFLRDPIQSHGFKYQLCDDSRTYTPSQTSPFFQIPVPQCPPNNGHEYVTNILNTTLDGSSLPHPYSLTTPSLHSGLQFHLPSFSGTILMSPLTPLPSLTLHTQSAQKSWGLDLQTISRILPHFVTYITATILYLDYWCHLLNGLRNSTLGRLWLSLLHTAARVIFCKRVLRNQTIPPLC